MKKFIALVMTGLMIMSTNLFAWGRKISKKTPIGVSMPTKDLQRWNQDGANMKDMLEKAGYRSICSTPITILRHRPLRLRI